MTVFKNNEHLILLNYFIEFKRMYFHIENWILSSTYFDHVSRILYSNNFFFLLLLFKYNIQSAYNKNNM